jgi:hypothetical protein
LCKLARLMQLTSLPHGSGFRFFSHINRGDFAIAQ